MSDNPLQDIAVEIANFAERRINEVFGHIERHNRPNPSIALLIAFAHQRTVETDKMMADWAKATEGARVIAVAKRLCNAEHPGILAGESWENTLVQGNLAPPMILRFGKHQLADVMTLAGISKPLWTHYIQAAQDAIKAVDGAAPELDATKLAPMTRLTPVPPETLMVEQ